MALAKGIQRRVHRRSEHNGYLAQHATFVMWSITNTNTSPIFDQDPCFESGTASWLFYTSGTGTSSTVSPGYEGSNTAQLALSSGSLNIQMYQEGIALEPNTRYRLSFAAYSTTGHDVTVKLLEHVSPYTAYVQTLQQISIRTGRPLQLNLPQVVSQVQ